MMRGFARGAAVVVDALAVASFVGMFLCVLAQVVLRYVFDRPLVWSDELARYLFVWCAFLGWIVAARRRSHLAIGALSDRCGPRGRACFAFAGAIVALIFAAVLFGYGVQITLRNADVDTVALFFSFAFVYVIVPIASLAVAVYAASDAMTAFAELRGSVPR